MAGIQTQVNTTKLRQLQKRPKLQLPEGFIVGFICFVVTVVVCWFAGHSGMRAAVEQLYDSGHYMETCRQLALFLQGRSSETSAFDVNKLIEYLMLDGPVLPILAGGAFFLFHQMPGSGDWWLFAGLQYLLQGFAAVLVASLTQELVGSRKWALAAGLTWGLYPAAILATRVVMAETLTVVLLLLEVYLLCHMFKHGTARQIGSAIGSGTVAGLVLLTKPALFAVCALASLLAAGNLSGTRRKIVMLLTFALGVVVTLLPWLIFTKTCVGQVYLAPQRQPVFNVAKGCDIEADGLGGFPNTISCNMHTEADGVLNVLSSVVINKPVEFASLCVRKVIRLFALPWNDYRAKLFGLSAQTQAILHKFIWLIGLLGVLAICAGLKAQTKLGTKVDRQNLFIGEACALMILGHLGYVIFEAIPRYGFTAMPFVVVLAIYFLHGVIARKTVLKEVLLLAVSVLMVLVSLEADVIPYLLFLTDDMSNALWLGLIGQWLIIAWTLWLTWRIADRLIGQKETKLRLAGCLLVFLLLVGVILVNQKFNRAASREWQSVLTGNMVAKREVWLGDKTLSKPSWALILVDGDENIATSKIFVNGHELNEKLQSLYQFYPRKFHLLNAIQLQAVSLGVKPELLRQWRAVPIPVAWLNLNGKNVLSVKPADGKKITLYGDYPVLQGERRYVPSFEFFSHGKLWNSVNSLDGRILSPIALSDVRSRSSITSEGRGQSIDLSKGAGVQAGDYRLFIALGKNRSLSKSASKESGQVADLSVDELVISPNDLSPVGMKELTLAIPKGTLHSHIQVNLTGQVLSHGVPMPVTAVLIAETADSKSPVILPGTPQVIYVGRKWSSLNVSEILPTGAVLGGIGKLCMQMYLSPQSVQTGHVVFRDLKLSVTSVDKPNLDDHWMGIY